MNATDTALYSKLTADATLLALLFSATSIYSWQAPDNARLPFVIFNDMSDTEPNDTRHEIHNMIYQVRGFTAVSMKAAKAIDARIRVLLHEGTLTISGHTLLRMERIGAVRFVENQQSTSKVYSAGGLYRLVTEAA